MVDAYHFIKHDITVGINVLCWGIEAIISLLFKCISHNNTCFGLRIKLLCFLVWMCTHGMLPKTFTRGRFGFIPKYLSCRFTPLTPSIVLRISYTTMWYASAQYIFDMLFSFSMAHATSLLAIHFVAEASNTRILFGFRDLGDILKTFLRNILSLPPS